MVAELQLLVICINRTLDIVTVSISYPNPELQIWNLRQMWIVKLCNSSFERKSILVAAQNDHLIDLKCRK